MNNDWPFDQTDNTAAISTVNVIEYNYPILYVIHYEDDYSWGFFCGITDEEKDGRVISMKEIVEIDPSVLEIAHLLPGQQAYRNSKQSKWIIK